MCKKPKYHTTSSSSSSTPSRSVDYWDQDLCGDNQEECSLVTSPFPPLINKKISAASALSLADAPTIRGKVPDGISFNVSLYTSDSTPPHEITKQFVSYKSGAHVCYENTLFTEDFVQSIKKHDLDVIIHQSVAPCKRCRAGYKKLAQEILQRNVIVDSDDRYDGAGPNATFVFPLTGKCERDR